LALALVLGLGSRAAPLVAQGYRVRLDTRVQSLTVRGLAFDSVLRTQVVTGPNGGFMTADGIAVSCPGAAAYCTFFSPGPEVKGAPVTGTASATFWGFGVPGLQFNLQARASGDLTQNTWFGTEPPLQLLEGYAQYSRGAVTAQLGRTHDYNRLGWIGFDGAKLEVRPFGRTLRIFSYGGRGLARTFPLPVTAAELNPLGDTLALPNKNEIVLGGGFGWFFPIFEGRVLYQREDRSGSDATVSERVAADGSLAISQQLSLSGGGDYNVATDEWGKADVALNYLTTDRRVRLTVGGRRYRPYFDLWSIWAAFAPVAYSLGYGSAAWQVIDGVEIRARGELYQFDAPNASTPLVSVDDNGWRGSVSASVARFANWSLDAGYERDIGPGASSQSIDAAVTYRPTPAFLVTVDGARMVRPLEYRFDDARLWSYGLRIDYQAMQGLRLIGDARGYSEDRNRPDAAALSWDQLRLNLGASIEFGSGSDTRRLHPAILRVPEGRRPR
jgi:hypothetical protein